jgi:hypothetical protein
VTRWVVVKHDGGKEEILAFRDSREDALATAEELRAALPTGSLAQLEVRQTRQPKRNTQPTVDTYNSTPTVEPRNCDDIRAEVARKPYRPGERAYIIKKAIELGCTDSIPDTWTLEFTKEP